MFTSRIDLILFDATYKEIALKERDDDDDERLQGTRIINRRE